MEFLHNHARLIHRAISPKTVLTISSGAWKLSGFGFAISSYQASDDLANVPAFHYAEYDVEDSILLLQPSLNYTAPEMVQSRGSPAGPVSDIFSFRCLAYHLIAHKPLFDCHNNMEMYTSSLTYLTNGAFTSIPSELVPDMQIMLSTNESFRPTALEFTGSPFFGDDTRLRAFRFLDHMLERDNMQEFEFLKALSDMMEIHAEQLVMIIISMLTRIGHSQFCSRPSLRQYSQKEILKLMLVMPSKLKRLHEP